MAMLLYTAALSGLSPRLFSSSKPGVVYSSAVKINCAYGGDGGTRKYPSDGGCSQMMCPSETDLWCQGVAHPASQMSAVYSQRPGNGYNEVRLNASHACTRTTRPLAADAQRSPCW